MSVMVKYGLLNGCENNCRCPLLTLSSINCIQNSCFVTKSQFAFVQQLLFDIRQNLPVNRPIGLHVGPNDAKRRHAISKLQVQQGRPPPSISHCEVHPWIGDDVFGTKMYQIQRDGSETWRVRNATRQTCPRFQTLWNNDAWCSKQAGHGVNNWIHNMLFNQQEKLQ